MPLRPVRRALLSVSDKTGLIDFATALVGRGIALISTGGTAKALRDAGLPVEDVSAVTGFPEIMDGRVKTLHPKIHGGLLALRDKPDHAEAMRTHGIEGIDLLVCNLYPFEATVARGADFDETIENIDIGGPAMIRAASKNHGFVTVVVDPEDYAVVIAEMQSYDGATTDALRRRLAQTAYARTAAYDAAVSNWLAEQLAKTGDTEPPRRRAFAGHLRQKLRYGENPHQQAAFYTTGEKRYGVSTAEQLQGKELSYNNINDTDAAYELVAEFDPQTSAACAIIKHANPCGVALGENLTEAYRKALACDPVSAFGGVLAFNRTLDGATAEEIAKLFTEVIIAPDAERRCATHSIVAKESPPSDRRRFAGSDCGRSHHSHRCRWLPRADARQCAHRPRRPQDRDKKATQRKRNRRHAVRFHRRQACEVEHDCLRQRHADRRHRRGPDESCRFRAHRRHQSARSGPGGRLARAINQRFGRCVRRVLSVR